MARRKKQEWRVLGPYPKGETGRYYLVTKSPGGERNNRVFASKRSAEHAKQTLESKFLSLRQTTLEEGFDLYEVDQERRGLKQSTRNTTRYCLERFFPNLQKPITSITEENCKVHYKKLCEELSPDTHRGSLSRVQAFFGYLVKQGLLEKNPAENIEPVGRRRQGKEQLTLSEARIWVEVALREARSGKEGAIAALMSFFLALRSSEVVGAKVRDVDDEGRLFWVPGGKTKNARRKIRVPEILSVYLLWITLERNGNDWLFLKGTKKRHRYFVRYWVQKICRESGVPEVCAHSMRGLHASLAVESGASARIVANTLGHGTVGVTERHYLKEGAKEEGRGKRFLEVLKGGRSE